SPGSPANAGLAGGLGVQRGGRRGGRLGRGLRPGACEDAAPPMVQPPGAVVRNAGSPDRLSRPIRGPGGVGAGDRSAQCAATSFALVGGSSPGAVPNTVRDTPPRTVTCHC